MLRNVDTAQLPSYKTLSIHELVRLEVLSTFEANGDLFLRF